MKRKILLTAMTISLMAVNNSTYANSPVKNCSNYFIKTYCKDENEFSKRNCMVGSLYICIKIEECLTINKYDGLDNSAVERCFDEYNHKKAISN